jgi:hypothetical protein
MIENIIILPSKWVWWTMGECVVEVLSRGHYPTTVMVKLPSDLVTEVELGELALNR